MRSIRMHRGRSLRIASLALLGAAALGMAASPPAARAAEPTSFVVVASGKIAVPDDPETCRHLVRALWLRRLQEWPDGTPAEPVSRGAGSVEDRALAEHILAMSDSDLDRHWSSLKQRTGQTRPREIRWTSAAIQVLRLAPGSFTVLEQTGEVREDSDLTVVLSFP